MGNLGFSEIMLIMVVVLLLFGARRLPEIGASFGKGIREFKRSLSDVTDSVNTPVSGGQDQASRSIDAPAQQAPTSGEPKRLSQ
ncbi:MAG: twin-arginine translocase TatA/TatE family subunit [Gemmatimonadota bacterium]|jgi:sec-independent protein translocase protein TatA|nr:twin-arginine translocase TatA/TatE family subunit [Gemmatimonadota bacterium]